MCNIQAFKFKLLLWESQLDLQNLVHFPHLKSHDTLCPRRIQQYSLSILLLREDLTTDTRTSKTCNQNFCSNYLQRQVLQRPRKPPKMEIVNFHCDTDLNCKFSATRLQDFYSYSPKDYFPALRSFAFRSVAKFVNTHGCEKFLSLMENNKTKRRSHMAGGHL